MKQLIQIKTQYGKQLVSARELHNFLEVGRDFSTWCKQMTDYGFVENQDYTLLTENGEQTGRGGHNKTDYALTLDTAKHWCMMQRSEKGMQARQYFIEAERKLKDTLYIPQTYSEALRFAATQIEEKEALQHQIAMNAPKLAIANAFEASTGVCSVAELAHILTQNGYKASERTLFPWLRENGYLHKRRDVWNQPTQYSIDRGLFEIKRTLIERSNGVSEVRNTPKVTIKGQAHIIKLLTGNIQPTKSLTAC